jgi:hypothetical protein
MSAARIRRATACTGVVLPDEPRKVTGLLLFIALLNTRLKIYNRLRLAEAFLALPPVGNGNAIQSEISQ